MSIKITSGLIRLGGSFILEDYLKRVISKVEAGPILNKYGRIGCDALAHATPIDSGETARSWTYEIEKNETGHAIYWMNTHENKGVNIAIILQYGHGTGTGGYVEGLDYINPALRPVFQNIADEAWQEMMK